MCGMNACVCPGFPLCLYKRRAPRRAEITPLNGLGTKTLAFRNATAKNNAFIAQRRCNARELLQRAHDSGVLPYTNHAADSSGILGTGTGKAGDKIEIYDTPVSASTIEAARAAKQAAAAVLCGVPDADVMCNVPGRCIGCSATLVLCCYLSLHTNI